MTSALSDYTSINDGDTRRVRLTRLRSHAPEVVFEGEVTFDATEMPPIKRGSQARPAGHKTLILRERDDWAEYATCYDFDPTDGSLTAEDYKLELVG